MIFKKEGITLNSFFFHRMFHMGCPVIFGDKWVMTKWLYSDDQMWMHPCSSKFATKDNFPIFSNIQRFRSDFNLELDE